MSMRKIKNAVKSVIATKTNVDFLDKLSKMIVDSVNINVVGVRV